MKTEARKFSSGWLYVLIGLICIWSPFLWQLRYSWDSESYYSYGWLVPFLGGVLIWMRAGSPLPDWISEKIDHWDGTPVRIAVVALACVSLLFYGLAMVAMEANPFWRFPLWLAGLSLVAISLAALYLAGGIRTVFPLVFPLLFSLTMVPWPFGIENFLISNMTRGITVGVVELLRLLSYPAVQFGNVIQVGAATVGVEEACSGIKSVQALFMLTLFVGVFWRLRIGARVALVLFGFVIAGFFNLLRSLALSLIVIEGGDQMFDQWHDIVGHIALFLSIASAFLIGAKLPVLKESEEEKRQTVAYPRRFLGPLLGAPLVLFAVLPIAFSSIWYSDVVEETAGWHVDVGRSQSERYSYTEEKIHERIKELLGFDYGSHYLVSQVGGEPMGEVWFYGFTGENIRKSLGAYSHTPDICMTASGATLISQEGEFRVDVGLLEIPFQQFVFRLPNGAVSQVFWCLWDDVFQGDTGGAVADTSRRSIKIQAVLKGRIGHKRKVMLSAMHGVDSEHARSELKRIVRDLVVVTQNGETVVFD